MLTELRQERERRSRADESEPEPETARTAAGGEGRLFFRFWRSIVDSLSALLRYFLG